VKVKEADDKLSKSRSVELSTKTAIAPSETTCQKKKKEEPRRQIPFFHKCTKKKLVQNNASRAA
jgi:hypothetical protein